MLASNAPSSVSMCHSSIQKELACKRPTLKVRLKMQAFKEHFWWFIFSILLERPWQSCAIFCQRSDREGFYSPRFELNSLPEVSAHFPDGTWCGNDGQKDLYCLHRSCVSTEVAEGLVRSSGRSSDLDMANNAPMTGKVHHKIPAALEVGSFEICVH